MNKARVIKSIVIWFLIGVCVKVFLGKKIRRIIVNVTASNIPPTVHLVAVSCGRPNYQGIRDIQKPMDQTLTMIKSAVLFAQAPLKVHIFTENDMTSLFRQEISAWPKAIHERFSYKLYKTNYKDYMPLAMAKEWQKWYKPCGSFRLLIPLILKETTDAAIYSDSDVVFIQPIDQLWNELKSFSSHQVAAISPTAGRPIRGSKFNENFIYQNEGNFQINTGVMLMNFTRMLKSKWTLFHDETAENPDVTKMQYGVDLLMKFYEKYRNKVEHDQKMLNIMYHYNPDFLKQLSCAWNFKHNFCSDESNICQDAESLGGAKAVHGISSAFFGDVNPTFKALYESFLNYDFEPDIMKHLLKPFVKQLRTTARGTFCEKKSRVILEPLAKSVTQMNALPDTHSKR